MKVHRSRIETKQKEMQDRLCENASARFPV